MASLDQLVGMFFDPNAPPPALNLANISLAGDTARADTSLQEGIISQNLPWTLRDIVNERAARGGYRSGQTTRALGREVMGANQQVAQGRYELNKQLMELARNRFLTSVGIPLGTVF